MKFRERRVDAFNRLAAPFHLVYEPGIVYVEGDNRDVPGVASSNGTGKSLLVVESLLYCLFGRMARHGNKLVTEQACHRINGADVTEVIELKPGYVVHVRRHRAVQGRPGFSVTFPDGKPAPISKDPTKRAEDVQGLLGLDWVAFRSAVAITRGQTLAGADFSQQMLVLEGILRLDELNDAAFVEQKRAAATSVGVRAAEAIATAKTQAIETAKTFLSRMKETVTFDFAEAIAMLREDVAEADKALEAATLMNPVILDHRQAVQRAAEAYSGLYAKAAGLAHELGQIQDIDTTCPTCNRPFKNAKELEEQRRLLEKRRVELKAKHDQLVANGLQDAATKQQHAQGQLSARETEYARLIGIAQGREDKEQQITQLEEQQHQQDEQMQLAEQAVSIAEKEFEDAAATLVACQRRQARQLWWAKEFGRDGMQAQIFAEALPILNHHADGYGRRLLADKQIAFNPLRTSRNEDLIRINDGALTYEDLSDGEKERCNLVIAFSLRALARWRLPEPVNLLILDEVVSSVDPAGTAIVIELLNEEVKDGVTVFVISHDPEQRKAFPAAKLMTVIRQGDEATVYV